MDLTGKLFGRLTVVQRFDVRKGFDNSNKRKKGCMTKEKEMLNLQRRIQGVTMPIGRKRMKWGRNWPCLCGKDKKYKNCCANDIDSLTAVDGNATVEALPEDIQKLIDEHNQREEEKKRGKGKNG